MNLAVATGVVLPRSHEVTLMELILKFGRSREASTVVHMDL